MLKKEEGEIDWGSDPRSIHNMVRGLLPWPCAYTFFGSKVLKILKSTYRLDEHALEFGTLSRAGNELTIACRQGFLLPLVLQVEGKKAVDARAFSNGLRASRVMLGNAARS
jgi:methionyl-tRNA formyltransferase